MESDEGKLFVGGIPWDTTEDKLSDYFTSYGEVSRAVIMRDKITGRPRSFAFTVFSDPSVLYQVLQDKHTIDGRTVEVKRALSREEQHSSRSGNFNSSRGSDGGGNFTTKKIFVGGLPATLTEDGFRQYFESYGYVTDVVIMYDQNTQRPRGFGFITFDLEDAVDMVLQKTFHELDGKLVEVKQTLPKDASSSGGSRGRGYQGQGYGASGVINSTFDSRMHGSGYMQPQSAGGDFPSYSGYSAPAYGYRAAGSLVGYGSYGGYETGGYGGVGSGSGGLTGMSQSREEDGKKRQSCVVVLGDVGRSPRMQYHALSLALQGLSSLYMERNWSRQFLGLRCLRSWPRTADRVAT